MKASTFSKGPQIKIWSGIHLDAIESEKEADENNPGTNKHSIRKINEDLFDGNTFD